MPRSENSRRTRVERGIYRQPNGNYAVCAPHAGERHPRTLEAHRYHLVRAQLSRAHRGKPARRVAPKTPASMREVPLVEQLSRQLAAHKQASRWGVETSFSLPLFARSGSNQSRSNVAAIASLRAGS